MKKTLTIVLAISTLSNSIPSFAETYIKENNNLNNIEEFKKSCVEFDLNAVYEAMQEKKQICVQNPFLDEKAIVPISFRFEDNALLKPEDFNNILPVYKKYLEFTNQQKMNSSDVMISEIMLSNGTMYKFFKYVYDSKENLDFKKQFSGKIINKDIDDFLFFHEMMHLSPRHSSSYMSENKIRMNQIEATADFGATLMISIKNGYNLDTTLKMIQELESVRRKPINKNTVVTEHYNRHSFKEIKDTILTEEFKKEFEEISKLDFNRNFKEIIRRVENLAFEVQSSDFKKKHKIK